MNNTGHPQERGRRLVAVVVTHNRLCQLRLTLARLLETPHDLLSSVVVIDSASSDGTAPWLGTLRDPRLIIERSETNLGGAGGFERGMRLAVAQCDPDWIVVMDDDARPAPGALAAFHAQEPSGWDAIAAAVHYPAGGICEMNRPSRNPFWHSAVFLRTLAAGRGGFHLPPAAYQGPPQQVDIASFVGLFVSRGAISRVGYPDGRLFVYGDDGLYTLGLSQAGGRIGFVPAVRFEHDCSTLSGGASGRFRPLWKVYYYHRNLLLLYRMAAGWMFWPSLIIVLPKWLAKVRHHDGQRRAFLGLMVSAIRDGLAGQFDRDHETILAAARR
ncbi:glycosyltransferase [Rhodobacter veldkampii DSM 11550]|uniref:Glycosyltransferase n=1 Tax=Phaeovulum veldkampii DSM 11550 TaxID=1185920 RepID=A0A2T4JLE4_9RHOB|nr:glycosyltransferase [Phaeovulum veldkampii]MBK5947070.1 glycosyltransferase [Phaeovulum veldkampii DSM 11550]NCU19194.1 glycosyltransferase [Candidatus Falkowbacteria bacterium]PTE18683.1 glycosyltransferase [Phaeovulum veldkampii DSM 11550]TDQ57317.1 GT2 family glycosyltransferase [Phaeovulum veldkampii DSM 11550]